jgi:hypothetical protein
MNIPQGTRTTCIRKSTDILNVKRRDVGKKHGNCFDDITQLTDILNVANCERRLRNYIL